LRGAEGLVRYIVGDYARAARAYRAHHATGYEPLPGLPSAPSLASTTSSAESEDVEQLLTEGEAALTRNDLNEAEKIYARILTLESDPIRCCLADRRHREQARTVRRGHSSLQSGAPSQAHRDAQRHVPGGAGDHRGADPASGGHPAALPPRALPSLSPDLRSRAGGERHPLTAARSPDSEGRRLS
jgi:hypothetical protein